ncbi:hypothetical protein Ocin01_15734 [Orchesella cincta]|uniref:Uncharacterized protein n=1 Tax=Orchesella cincta TaxID=48709 RepID=A0A1D2MD65_ORCCI|nr:hypothetical protein Ocin01_15734 [Orchesella cincta]
MCEIQTRSNRGFRDALVTVSESNALLEAKAVWELKDWNNPINIEVFKSHANCVVDVDEETALCFYLKEKTEPLGIHRFELVYLSLNACQLFKGANSDREKELLEEGLTVKISVEYLNENLDVVKEPMGYTSIKDKYVSFGGKTSPSERTVMKNFIMVKIMPVNPNFHPHNIQSTGDGFNIFPPQSSTGRNSPTIFLRPEVLRYGITVESFRCSHQREQSN